MADDSSVELGLEQLGKLARSASTDFENLAHVVKSWGNMNPMKSFVVTLKEARQLLKDSGHNLEAVKSALKGAGIAAVDLKPIMRQLTSDINSAREASMGFHGMWQRAIYNIFSPTTAHKVESFFGRFRGLAGGAFNLASRGFHKSVEIGEGLLDKALELAQFKEASTKGLAYILSHGADEGTEEAERGKKDAQMLMQESLKLAKLTPIADKEIVAAVKDFATAGYQPKQAIFLAKVMADQQSKFLEDPRVKNNFVTAFNRMQGKGVASLRDLESLRIAKFNVGAILEQLPNQKGMPEIMKKVKGGKFAVTAEDIAKAKEGAGEGEISGKELENLAKLQKIISLSKQAGSPIAASTLANAAIASLYKGKELSSAAGGLANMKAVTTLTGAVNNAENAFDNLMLSMDLAESKGGTALKDFLNIFSSTVSESHVLKDTLTGIFDAVFEPLKKFTKEDIEKIIKRIGKLGETVINFIKTAWDWFSKLLDAKPGKFLEDVGAVLVDVGKYIGEGILKGVTQTAVGAVGQAAGISDVGRYSSTVQGSSAKAWGNLWEDTGGAASAWVYDLIAPDSQKGGSVRKMAEGGVVDKPTLAMIGEGGEREFVIPESKMSRMGGVNISIPIALYYSGGADPDSLEAAIEPVVTRAIQNAAQRLAMEMG